MEKIFNVYRNVLFAVAIIFLIVTCLPMLFGIQPFVVLSGSMEPQIHVGSVCYINKNIESSEVITGDVIAFSIDETTVVHRIHAVNEETGNFIMKGDNNESVDLGEVSQDMIIGKAMFSIPYLGYVVKWIQEPKGIIVAGAAILISIVSSLLYSDSRKTNKKQEVLSDEKVN